MSLINRIEDLVKSEVNAFLDKAEDPNKMAEQLILDLQEALNECRTTAAGIICEQKALQRVQKNNLQAIESWQNRAEKAITNGREDLAKAALIEKQTLVEKNSDLESPLQELEEALSKLNTDADKLAGKLQELKSKQQQLRRYEQSIGARIKVRETLSNRAIDTALSRFTHLEQKVERIEAEIQSYDFGSKTTSQQFAEMEKEQALAEELSKLKQKVAGKAA